MLQIERGFSESAITDYRYLLGIFILQIYYQDPVFYLCRSMKLGSCNFFLLHFLEIIFFHVFNAVPLA